VERKKSPYVGILQHTPGGSFVLCPAIEEPSCSRSTRRNFVRTLWERATKKKGKGKSDVGAACPLPSKKPNGKTPTAKKPKTKTPKKTKKTKTKKAKKTKPKKTTKPKPKKTKPKKTMKPKTKKTKAKMVKSKKAKKGGKL
jgi:hypothetical protein